MEIVGEEGNIKQRQMEIEKLFPKHDLSEVLNEYQHLSTEALVNFICEMLPQIPKKPKEPHFCTRLAIKVYTLATALTRHLPSWFGGRLLNKIVDSAIQCPDDNISSFDPREKMKCSVCWESAIVEELCFCDPIAAATSTNGLSSSKKSNSHCFCRRCLESHALATLEEMPLAKGGLGLRCMDTDCDNPITFHEISVFISAELAKKLEDRAAELSVTQAELNYLERCRKCNCAVEVGKSPKQMQTFKCPECKFECCRLCNEPWEKTHQGISCDEFLKNRDHDRLLEKRLSEAVVRNCPKCKLAFVKGEGCNKITCKCGYTLCYICRESNITYGHFCSCPCAEKRKLDGSYNCHNCNKTCLLWENPELVERHEMERIKTEVKLESAKTLNLKKTT